MELILLKNLIWPALLTVSIISFLDYVLDREKKNKYLCIIFLILAIPAMIYFMLTEPGQAFLQLYLFMFFLSISLVILALKKRIDAFTIIGIFLMLAMLILLLRFSLI